MDLAPDRRVEHFFTTGAESGPEPQESAAMKALTAYFAPGLRYTGSAFDELIADAPVNEFTATDIVAVSMLSVHVPPRAAHHLLSGEANDLLAAVPVGATLWSNPELLDRNGPTWQLWDRVDGYKGCGRTITSKILAAKRPGLVPVYDQHVDDALEFGTNYWSFWQTVASSGNARSLLDLVAIARQGAGVPDHVSDLRVIDVVVWMLQHGVS